MQNDSTPQPSDLTATEHRYNDQVIFTEYQFSRRWRRLFFVSLGLSFLTVIACVYTLYHTIDSQYDRERLRNGQQTLEQAQKIIAQDRINNQQMLDARAFAQETDIIVNWQNIPLEKRVKILDNWEKAEYSVEGKQYLMAITSEYQRNGDKGDGITR